MTTIKVNFEIGHEAWIRTKKTPEGFTHDWEVFVRGQEGADISHFVDKVVFHLHETFPKPKRVVKEPPFSVKESGYAGFILPIEIYLKNRDDPKKIKFSYDLTLQQSGFLKDRYIFESPNEDFKKKLLKGGGIIVNNNAFYTNPDQESRSRDSFNDDRTTPAKPKIQSEKKHKSKEHKDEPPHRTSSFENLFGPPLQKPHKVSPDPKKIDKNASLPKTEKKEKDRSSSDKVKSKHDHKEPKPEKVKSREDKEKSKSDKVKSHKDEKSKDKASKRPSERLPSPEPAKKRCPSPNKRPGSPPVRSSSASSIKEEYKPQKVNIENFKEKQTKIEEKIDVKSEKEVKEKKKKEKKSHDKDKERKEKKEHRKEKEREKAKESPKEPFKEVTKEVPKPRETPKEKEVVREVFKDKNLKPEKAINKFSLENLKKTPQESTERYEEIKVKEVKPEGERKHKHKKKDKKRDESREKHKDSSKEKKHKHEKSRELIIEKPEPERRETPVPKDRALLEPASPISVDTASQGSIKSGPSGSGGGRLRALDDLSSHSDSDDSDLGEDERLKKLDSPPPAPRVPSPPPEPEPQLLPLPEHHHKDKSKKHKDKSSKKEEKKRKRKAADEEDEARKLARTNDSKMDLDQGESSGMTSTETKVQDNGVSSSLGEDAEGGEVATEPAAELSPDYMVQLRGLQQRIMTIKSNEDLERVVDLIAETGRYEVTTQTFDFDLCLLDRATVQQLIQLVGC